MDTNSNRQWATVADSLRRAIQEGEWAPGDPLPTTAALRERFKASGHVVSKAIQHLKNEGLVTGVAGGRTRVRVPRPHAVRDSERYIAEKRNVLEPTDERARYGASEADTGIAIDELYEDRARYEVVSADTETARLLNIEAAESVLQRTYTRRHAAGAGITRATSYIPLDLISGNPDLLDSGKEPWPGGTQHQLSTVGIEIDCIVDRVTAAMPTPAERDDYDIPQGVPLLHVVKISHDTEGRPVELTRIPMPADTVELVYRTQLPRWDECR